MAVEFLRYASSAEAAASEVFGNSIVVGGEQREYFDLKEDELVPHEEVKDEPNSAPHPSKFQQQRELCKGWRVFRKL